jgi:hypothetical protein
LTDTFVAGSWVSRRTFLRRVGDGVFFGRVIASFSNR